MPTYKYRVRNSSGGIGTGNVEAVSEAAAIELLEDKGLIVLSLAEGGKSGGGGFNINIGRVKSKDIVIFSRQLSVMVSATVPIVQALKILASQTANVIFVEKIMEMANDVDGGMKLSASMAKHEKVFSHFYIAMVKSGETSGKLDEVLQYLADQMEKDYDLVSRIKGAMIYPVFIIFGMITVGFLMMIFVVPNMTQMLTDSGAELPFLTKILIAVSSFMQSFWWLIIGAVVGLFFLFKMWTRTQMGKVAWDTTKVKFPIFGPLFQKIYIVRFARGFSTLIKGGVPVSASLRITSEVVDNQAYKKLILDTIKEVEDGNSVSTLFSKSELMPKMLSQMMSIGEQTGKLDDILEKLADFYSREIDSLVNGLTSLIEPLILMVMGVGVGGMVAAIMMPMFKVAQSIS
jgi:type IV pilus assembly protein PilC